MEDLMVVCDVRHKLEQHSRDVRREDMVVGSRREEKVFDRRRATRYSARMEVEAAVLDPFCVCL
jgi:hypothetical protein